MTVVQAPLLEAAAVTFRVGRQVLVDSASLSLRCGEVLALVGPNGAGKSTLMHLLSGDLTPTAGEVRYDGRSIRAHSADSLALLRAVLPQRTLLQFAFTAEQVVLMGRSPHVTRRGHETAEDRATAIAAMERTDTTRLGPRSFPTLSGGESSRVSLARVLAQQTPVVLLDEPTASLDVRHQEAVMQTAASLAAEGCGVLAVLHDLNLAAAYATTVAVMHAGRVAACGRPDVVLREDLLSEVFEHRVRVLTDPDRACPLIVPYRPVPATSGRTTSTHTYEEV
ncbi:MAG: heme ABC transporter ATP-binding protein [Dehalococcoidia bacterium]